MLSVHAVDTSAASDTSAPEVGGTAVLWHIRQLESPERDAGEVSMGSANPLKSPSCRDLLSPSPAARTDVRAGTVQVTVGNVTTTVARRQPVSMSVRGLHYAVPKPHTAAETDPETKVILRDVSFDVAPGEVMAILGPSGGGKTSLLNVLGGRVGATSLAEVPLKEGSTSNEWKAVSGPSTVGCVYVNGTPQRKSDKRCMGYVLQDDVFLSQLSVRETLTFTAELRMAGTSTAEERRERVQEVIDLLGITKAADSLVGDTHTKSISGGERRRLNVANEMITDPSLLLLDEPSSGLDSYAALRLFDALSALAAAGRTIITTVHQPNSQLWSRFTKVLLLSEGGVMYCGPPAGVVPFLCSPSVALPPPPGWSTADWMLEVANGDRVDDVKQLWRRVEKDGLLLDSAIGYDGLQLLALPAVASDDDGATAPAIPAKQVDDGGAITSSNSSEKWPTSWWQQFRTLSRRAWASSRGNNMTGLRLVEAGSLTIVCSLLWWQVPSSAAALEDKIGIMVR